ncbi:MAG: hypothetical protein EZS28_030991 [Streblomastix strix]|uniref:Uncharacterized protein n=1 Tax=Streblomastix strix TaxID=222440 RepID=A0A5J4UTQ4_9EUKA|nr:MAG: hypothetical protein EZS28_030991 [Streblomastix strix]
MSNISTNLRRMSKLIFQNDSVIDQYCHNNKILIQHPINNNNISSQSPQYGEVCGPDPFEKWREMAQVGPEGIQIQQGGEMMALGKAVLEGYYHVSLNKLDQTGERESEETRLEIRRREQMIHTPIHEDKAVISLNSDDNVTGDAQKRREVAIVPSSAKKALLTGGGLTILLGSESKAIVAEALKSSKLIAAQQTTNFQQIAEDKTQQQDNRSWQPGQKRGLNLAPTPLPKPPLENHAESDQQKNQ